MLGITMPGMGELIFLAVLALFVFGPNKLPEIARTVGRTVATLKREANSTLGELKEAAEFEEFRDVADELKSTSSQLKSTSSDLRRSADVSGALEADTAKPAAAAHRETVPPGPAPFDPDAT